MDKQKYKQLLKAVQKENIIEFIEQNDIKNERGDPIEFHDHFFLYDIYRDWSPRQAIVKSSQIGGSLMMVQKVLYAAKHKGFNVIYTLPSYNFIRKFVPDKVNKFIDRNKKTIGEWVGGKKDTLDQKQIGENTIYFDSAFAHESQIAETSQGIALTADLLVHDESDRSSLKIIKQYRSRLDYSKYKGIWMFSNPTYPNVGVSTLWNRSDQKHWFIKCNHCNHEQYLDWPKNVDKEREIYICEKCNKELSDEARRVGRWVAKWSNRDISGYWINQLMAPWKSAKELIDIEKDPDTSKQYFYNFVLGKPYQGSDVVVDKDLILKNTTNRPSSKENVCIGVDTGLKKHVVVGTPYGIFQTFSTKDWGVIEDIRNKYDATMVIDALPDLTKPRELVQEYRGKVFINYFKEGMKENEPIIFKKKDKYGVVESDRTRMIERFIDKLIKGEIKFHMQPSELEEYIAHWEDMYRVETKDRMGNPIPRWDSGGNDHFTFSSIYYLIASEKATIGKGATIREKGTRFSGKKSFEIDDEGQIPAVTREEFEGKPKKDWRYI